MVLWIIGLFSALLISLFLIKFTPPALRWLGEFVDNALDIQTDTPKE